MPTPLAEKLLSWYASHARRLPWRDHPDPYAVWVSEIMLQQTQVETVIPYFERWMARFPSIRALAEADEQAVLSAWEGLGYYSRARNLHRAARQVVRDHGGVLPADFQQLLALPGVGRYTAAAVGSMAFGLDTAALDGNIRRVLARVFDVTIPARSPEGERLLWKLAQDNLPAGYAGDYNQALMDLGATLCTPRKPDCPRCPLNDLCLARQRGVQEQRPLLPQRPVVPHYLVTAAVLERGGLILLAQRPAQGLLGGLWEFPGGKVQDGESLPECLRRELREELAVEAAVGEHLGIFHHGYTHFKVTLHAFRCTLLAGEPQPVQVADLRWVTLVQLRDFPMGKIDRQIASQLIGSADSQKTQRREEP